MQRRQLCPCHRLCGFCRALYPPSRALGCRAGALWLGIPCAARPPVKHAAGAQQRYVGCREMPSPRDSPPGAMGLTRKLWDEGAQHWSRDWDTGIGKASVYKGWVPVTKITLCFPSLSLPRPTLTFVDVLKYKLSLGKMEAPSATNQERGENRRGGRENQERQIRIKHRGMLNRLRATVLASAVRQLSELIA